MAILATFTNQSIPSGTFLSPVAAVPADVRGLKLTMSRQNWPAAGATIALMLSFDGGNTFPETDATFIAAWVDDGTGKHPLSDAVITWGWGARRQPTHVKARSLAAAGYTSTVVIESL